MTTFILSTVLPGNKYTCERVSMSYFCEHCGTSNEELDFIEDELVEYKAKEFIDFVAAFGNVMIHYSGKIIDEDEKEFAKKAIAAYELSIAAYMRSSLSQHIFDKITVRAGRTFAQNMLNIYRNVFKKTPFSILDEAYI